MKEIEERLICYHDPEQLLTPEGMYGLIGDMEIALQKAEEKLKISERIRISEKKILIKEIGLNAAGTKRILELEDEVNSYKNILRESDD